MSKACYTGTNSKYQHRGRTGENNTGLLRKTVYPPRKVSKHSKKSSHKCRADQRRKRSLQMIEKGYVHSKRVLKRHIQPSNPILTPVVTEDLPVTGPGFIAQREEENMDAREYSLEEILGNSTKFGFRVEKWDGW
jgi:hypothetical protein